MTTRHQVVGQRLAQDPLLALLGEQRALAEAVVAHQRVRLGRDQVAPLRGDRELQLVLSSYSVGTLSADTVRMRSRRSDRSDVDDGGRFVMTALVDARAGGDAAPCADRSRNPTAVSLVSIRTSCERARQGRAALEVKAAGRQRQRSRRRQRAQQPGAWRTRLRRGIHTTRFRACRARGRPCGTRLAGDEALHGPARPCAASTASSRCRARRQRTRPRSLPLTWTTSSTIDCASATRIRLRPALVDHGARRARARARGMTDVRHDRREHEHRDFQRLLPDRTRDVVALLEVPDGVEQLHDRGDRGVEGAPPADVDRNLAQRLVGGAAQARAPLPTAAARRAVERRSSRGAGDSPT